MTYKFIVNPLIHCVTLLGDHVGKETTYIITLGFIVYLDKQYIATWKCSIPPQVLDLETT